MAFDELLADAAAVALDLVTDRETTITRPVGEGTYDDETGTDAGTETIFTGVKISPLFRYRKRGSSKEKDTQQAEVAVIILASSIPESMGAPKRGDRLDIDGRQMLVDVIEPIDGGNEIVAYKVGMLR